MYSNYPVARSDKFPPTPSKAVFIKLALVKSEKESREEADKFTRLTSQGDVDQILQDREPIEMDDILKAVDHVRLVVVEGAPGIGKSTLAWELCRQWPTLESLKRFLLVVLLRLREEGVQSATDISDLFPCEDDPGLSSLVAQEVKQHNGKGVLFVMDGFDEYPHKSLNSTVMKVIAGNLLPNATVIVTSRPSTTADVQSVFQTSISKHIEIVGFSRTEIQSYAESIFGKNSKILASFNTYLSANPVVKGMMYNPLNCAIVVGIYQDTYESGKPVPHTQTQLYTELTLCLLSRHLNATGNPLAGKLPDKLEDLPHDSDLYQQLVKVGQLAFNGTLRKELIFKQLPKGYSDLGLLIQYRALYMRKETSTYTFFHLTLQEYMSAFYISQLQDSEQRTLFIDHFSSMNNVVWRFVAGLTKMENIGWDEVKKRVGKYGYEYKVKDNVVSIGLFIIQCVYEAQDHQSCERVFGQHQVELQSMLTSHDSEFFALGYCVSLCSNTWNNIDLSITNIWRYLDNAKMFINVLRSIGKQLDMLSLGMKSVDYGGGSIRQLSLRMNKELFIQEHFLPPFILQHIESLIVTCYSCFETLAECIPYLHSLTALTISNDKPIVKEYVNHTDEVSLGGGSLVELLQALREHGRLQALYMDDIPMGMDDVAALAELVQSSNSLRELRVSLIDPVSSEVEQQLVKTVLSPSSLETVKVRTDLIHPLDYLENISDSITSLTLICDFKSSCSRAKWASKLSYIFRKNKSLKKLNLHIPLDKGEVCNILNLLKDNHSLEKLELSYKYHSKYFSKLVQCDSQWSMETCTMCNPIMVLDMDHRITFLNYTHCKDHQLVSIYWHIPLLVNHNDVYLHIPHHSLSSSAWTISAAIG